MFVSKCDFNATFISPTDQTPTIRELHKHVLKSVAAEWERLAITLHIDKDGCKIATIKRNLWGIGVEACCIEVFQRWLRGEGLEPVTWETMLESLRDLEYFNLAGDIEKHLLQGNFICVYSCRPEWDLH